MAMHFLVKHKLLLLHLSFWVLFASYRLFDYTRYIPFDIAVYYLGVPLFFNLIISYLHYFLIFPLLIEKKKYLKYTIWLIVSLIVLAFCRFTADTYFLMPRTPDQAYYSTIHISRVLSVLWDFMTFLIFTGMIKFTVDWFRVEDEKKQLKNEKLTAELNYLKSQINPHFLFNTLHNLNYLVQSRKEEASEVIIKLSNIMRYMIYDANHLSVSLSKEIKYMKDYINLERIRLNKPFKLTFNEEIKSESILIAPLLLIPFLENAFKHGVSDKAEDCWILVELGYVDGILMYKVANSKISVPSVKEKSGFGLENLKKRLTLHYPNKHNLSILDQDKEFRIELKVNLNND